MRTQAAAMLVALLTIAGCGGSGPDWDGYADYLNTNSWRGDPITGDELRQGLPKGKEGPELMNCDVADLADSWDLVPPRTVKDTEGRIATVYFMCGAGTARALARRQTDGQMERDLIQFIEEDLPTYGN